ncbi:hypothetical protein NQ318_006595 [Aromia moschata]|uniref:Uncharacterized protein n=1 Tax=Aromia moschata TaxID=1265417 RepID=A0AAV8XXP0_9CUCU|nr:hypothetical protein NQ318_006595 [Aromia moschata]
MKGLAKILLVIDDAYANHPLKPGKTKKNHNKQIKGNQHNFGNKVNYNNLSKQLFKRLDSSCKDTPPPDIPDGKFVKFKKPKLQDGKSKSKRYMVAVFECDEGYSFRDSHSGKMFCSKGKWVGKKPVCDRKHHDIDTLQGDDPNAASPPLFLDAGECPQHMKSKCKHTCRVYDSRATCECFPGFEKVGDDCQDVNECNDADVNSTCKYRCVNIIGSYYCATYPNETLSDQPVSDNDTIPKEGEDYEGEDDYDEDYEDEGDYDDEEYDEKESGNKEDEGATTESVDEDMVVDPPEIQERVDQEETDKSYADNKGNVEGKEVPITLNLTTTMAPVTVQATTERVKDVEDKNAEEESDDYDDGNNKAKDVKESLNTTEIIKPISNNVDNVKKEIGFEEATVKNISPDPTTIPTIVPENNVGYEENKTEALPDYEIEHTTLYEMPPKIIQNRLGEVYDDDKSEENVDETNKPVSSKVDSTKATLDKEEENYDDEEEEYDDEYYDEDMGNKKTTTNTPITTTTEAIDVEREHIKKIIDKLPEVDIEQINTDIHQIIANNPNDVDEEYETTTLPSVSNSETVTLISEGDASEYEEEDAPPSASPVGKRDQRSCRRTITPQCRVPMPPQHGILNCVDHRSDYGSLVPVGTKCNVWCDEGYKLDGGSLRVCNKAGAWDGDQSRCLVATCPGLPPIHNGWYLPGICNAGRTYKGEYCEVYCRKGFRRRPEFDRYICDNDLRWNPPIVREHLQDACVRDVPTAYIRCPANGFLDFTLPPGQRDMVVRIPKPESNLEFERYVTSYPPWGMHQETQLTVGQHEVQFTARAPDGSNSSCSVVINVLDKEEPRVNGCPEDIERNLVRGENMKIVHWREPTFYDNVGVANVYKSRNSGSEFGPGLHRITYVANDEAGNKAFCYFNVNVKEFDSEASNSIQQHATYTNHNSAGMYRALLVCPSGVQYMSNSPDNYSNAITREAGCHWEHMRVTKPMHPGSFRIPVYSGSRLPMNARSNRRNFFKWNR